LEPERLARAIAELDTVTMLRPYGADAWLGLVPLRYERGDLAGAGEAAERGLEGRPRRIEAPLAAAYMAYRRGDIERADSLFRAAIPRLAPDLRRRFDDPLAILDGSPDADSAATRAKFERLDPDPTTAANEAQLECWSRIAHAYFIFLDPLRPE